MLQKFLNLRRTDPTWFWLIVVLTLGLIFVVVIVMGVLFYLVKRRKSEDKMRDKPIGYHRLLNFLPPPRKFKYKLHRAKVIELNTRYPGSNPKDLSSRANIVVAEFEKQESRWASLFNRAGQNPKTRIKVWNARLDLNIKQKKIYEKQIKILQNQQKNLESEIKTAIPGHKTALLIRIDQQKRILYDFNNIRTWNNNVIDRIKDKINVLRK